MSLWFGTNVHGVAVVSTRKGRLACRFAPTTCLEMFCGKTSIPTSDCIVEQVTVRFTSAYSNVPPIISFRRLPGHVRPHKPPVGTILCPPLSTCSDGTSRTINLAISTARRPACGFRANDEAPLNLA